MNEGVDPRRIDSLAVHIDDVLTALEARERGRRRAVLRVTPPFSARMRARIHVVDGSGQEGGAIHFHPGCFVSERPEYPAVDDTEDELRERGDYDVERHRELHGRAVDDWRDTVRSRLSQRIELSVPAEGADEPTQTTLRVKFLG